MRIHILHCGSVMLPRALVEGEGRGARMAGLPLAVPGAARVTLPVSAYLIEHPRGLVLVDCGWCREVSPDGVYDARAARRALGAAVADFYRPTLPAGQAVHEQLAALGIAPHDLELVILTHLDPDHVSGVRHVADAKRIIVPEDEYFWSCRTVYKLRQPWKLWMDVPLERVFYRGFGGVPNNWAIDVFGDGTLFMVNLPGHTDGMAGVVAVNGQRFALLCADAGFTRRAWEREEAPGFGFDAGLQRKSLKWVREMEQRAGCAGVFASHDADIAPQTIEI